MAWAIAGVVLASLGYVGWRLTARSGYESAECTVVEYDGNCEISEYSDLMLASTSMQFESQGGDGSFMRLFGFISGRNEKGQKIAMTVPVFMDRDLDKSEGSKCYPCM